jgi:hypothetical protein
LFTGALHFLDVKEPLGKLAAGELAEGLIQIQRGLKLAGIRCEFHNFFWPPDDSNLRWFSEAERKVKATRQHHVGLRIACVKNCRRTIYMPLGTGPPGRIPG